MQRLRKRPNVIQRGLRNFLDFFQVGVKRGSLSRLFAGSAQHRANGGKYLPKFVVEFARNVPQRGFLRGNQLLRQIAALLGKLGEARKDLAVAANQVQAGEQNSDQSGCEEE